MPKDEQQGKTEDQLAELRKAREAEGLDPNEPWQTIDEVQAGTAEEDDGQVAAFVYEHGQKVTFGTLIKRGTDVEYNVKFGGKSVRGRGEPIPLEESNVVLAAHFVVGGYNVDAIRNDDDSIKKVKVYVKLKPKSFVDPASTQGKALLGQSSLLKAVQALREEGMSDEHIQDEFKAALAESLAA